MHSIIQAGLERCEKADKFKEHENFKIKLVRKRKTFILNICHQRADFQQNLGFHFCLAKHLLHHNIKFWLNSSFNDIIEEIYQ
jgi:hypothetical protein